MTITNDYIKGYVAALRTIQSGTEAMRDYFNEDSLEFELSKRENSLEVINNIIEFIEDQREHYKELVNKLNAENKV